MTGGNNVMNQQELKQLREQITEGLLKYGYEDASRYLHNDEETWYFRKYLDKKNSYPFYQLIVYSEQRTVELEKQADIYSLDWAKFPDELLKFFDMLNFNLTSRHRRNINQDISDWWE